MTPSTTPSASHPSPGSPSAPADLAADLHSPTVPGVTAPTIGELLSRLDGLEQRPPTAQVEVLDAVRRGLDQALSPASDQR